MYFFPNRYGGGYYDRYGGRNRYDPYDDRYPPPPPRPGDRYEGDRYDGDRGRFDYYGDEREGGSRWFFRPDVRRPGRRPPYDDRRLPYDVGPNRRPISPGPDGPIYDNYGGGGAAPGRPAYNTRCDEGEGFKQMGLRQRVRKEFVRRFVPAGSLIQCERECAESRDFVCRSFNYR